jgi:hypothetical protein
MLDVDVQTTAVWLEISSGDGPQPIHKKNMNKGEKNRYFLTSIFSSIQTLLQNNSDDLIVLHYTLSFAED